MKSIGITSTVPLEVLLAAGYAPLDLNNVLVSTPHPERFISAAERDGFPLNCCTWIKGIYSICREQGIATVLGVTGGDCSNTLMLLEVLRRRGVRTLPFAYPAEPAPALVEPALKQLAGALGTTLAAAEAVREQLRPVRALTHELDTLTWREGVVSGRENHLWLVATSDFNGDIENYTTGLKELLAECRRRQPYPADYLRLGYLGVPPVYARELYPFLEKNGARVVFNEIPRQFAMPETVNSLAEQYARYTYPYGLEERLRDIRQAATQRHLDGIIHYVQAFCHRGIADIVLREALDLPMLTIEGNTDFSLNSHLKTRLEAFLDMLRQRQHTKGRLMAESRP
ncbi:MAG: 2-hydroxyacyl-CoA dehydratase [Chloroflexota bacterium]